VREGAVIDGACRMSGETDAAKKENEAITK
jgi:cytoskeletal protein CcmA (bactofilin family)